MLAMTRRSLLCLVAVVSTMIASTLCSPPNLHTRAHHVHDHSEERIEDAFQSHLQHPSEVDDHQLDHEAVLGSRHKADEFEGLSTEDAKGQLKKLVETGMDANRDGYVDKQELTAWVLKSFKNLALEEGEDRLEEEDFDNDGYVTWSEHLKGSFDSDELIKDNDNLKNELLEEDRALWKAADYNRDDRLDAKEFAAFNSPEEFEHMHRVLVEQMLERRDRNRDGFIDFNEFISDEHGVVPDQKSEHYLSEKDKFTNQYDLNHDNRLDFDECLNWIVPNNTEIAENEATHLITSADMNNDGRLSVSEIVDNHDVFVGSEATDFGEQLRTHSPDEL